MPEKVTRPFVTGLPEAVKAYHAATNRKEEWAAQCQILLFGGADGYASGWRALVAQRLRLLALWLERR